MSSLKDASAVSSKVAQNHFHWSSPSDIANGYRQGPSLKVGANDHRRSSGPTVIAECLSNAIFGDTLSMSGAPFMILSIALLNLKTWIDRRCPRFYFSSLKIFQFSIFWELFVSPFFQDPSDPGFHDLFVSPVCTRHICH